MLCSREGKLVLLVGVAAVPDIKEHQPSAIKCVNKCLRYSTSIFFPQHCSVLNNSCNLS